MVYLTRRRAAVLRPLGEPAQWKDPSPLAHFWWRPHDHGKLESHRQRRARSPRNAGHASMRYSVKKGHQMKSLVTAMTSVFGGQAPTAIR